MRAFPPASDLQMFAGDAILQICLDPFSLQFYFGGGAHMTVERRIEHIDETGGSHPYDCQAPTGSGLYLHRLLRRRITAVEREPLRMSLIFEDGSILRIFSEEGPYQSGQIYQPGEKLPRIVF